ncbi:MAG: hypothetical protein R3291_03910 [Thermoplasmata archaeon]|nr:hypothetical protein [Thermoplasmata archaeon]
MTAEDGRRLTRSQVVLLVVAVVLITAAIALITGFRLLPPLSFP